jgi:hypothetical protein
VKFAKQIEQAAGIVRQRAPKIFRELQKLEIIPEFGVSLYDDRIHVSPRGIQNVSPETLAWALAHEAAHKIFGHDTIIRKILNTTSCPSTIAVWKLAMELQVNSYLITSGFKRKPKGIPIPGEGIHSHLPKNQSAIDYVKLIVRKATTPQ